MCAKAGGICFVNLWLIRLWEHHFNTKPRGTSTRKTGPLPIRFRAYFIFEPGYTFNDSN